MLLVGRDLSPFTRRVAISMQLLEIPFDRKQLAVLDDREEIRQLNPLTRVPALVVEEGEAALVESSLILAYIDSLVGPERALLPQSGPRQRRVLRLTGLATGAIEKAVASFYERTRRPQEFRFQTWIDHCDGQVRDALWVLDAAAAEATGKGWPWLAGETITQADVTTVVAIDFIDFTASYLEVGTNFPALARLAAKAGELPPFAETSLDQYRTAAQ